MLPFSPPPESAPPGDRARWRGTLSLVVALVLTPVSVLLFLNAPSLWAHIAPLEGLAFFASSFVFGLVLALAPVLAVAGWLLAIWFGVESVFMQRTRRTPVRDILIVCAGILAWSLPALGFIGAAIYALITGHVHFSQPPRDFLRTEEPILYWQSIGYMLLAASLFGWLAWRYWQTKLRRKVEAS